MGVSGYNLNRARNILARINYNNIFDEESKALPKDQYLCPFCGEIPELLNIHSDNGYVEFRCKKDKDYLISVQDYLTKLSDSEFTYYKTKCDDCNKLQMSERNNEKIFKYCYLCKKNLYKNLVRSMMNRI